MDEVVLFYLSSCGLAMSP